MNIFNWMGVFLRGPYDAILCLVLFHVIFSASCRDRGDGGTCGRLWSILDGCQDPKNRNALGLHKNISVGHGVGGRGKN